MFGFAPALNAAGNIVIGNYKIRTLRGKSQAFQNLRITPFFSHIIGFFPNEWYLLISMKGPPKYDFFLLSIPHKVKILFVKEQQ